MVTMYTEDPRLPSSTPSLDADEQLDWLVEPVPDTLTSSQTKLVYLYLSIRRGGTVEELRDALGMKTITLYPVLDHLVGLGLVDRDDDRYVLQAA
ncbi:hypothetical protein KU306_16135 (plasmid) [Haloferax larsenii]|uniref:Sugar-specific transcriptional regulator TrmB n=2 Tax=Haloferax larsenii TaxID=302484 RepID=A0ABY5RIF0_HALLR|nr:hypothetical protein C455_09353 [Haloferax larsenii JCM 13917]UVE52141.1 hypothetical protein KU306_16135 [Haloferax larsenii]